ncbi:hypothetical protein ACLMJK_007785 [Lecanora helva]
MRLSYLSTFVLPILPSLATSAPSHGWTEEAPIRDGPRQEESVTAVGTDLYIIGGIPASPPYPTLDRVEVFSSMSKIWQDAAPLPVTINHGNVGTVAGKIYILGGLNGTTDWIAIPSCFEYNPKNDTWTTLPSMPSNQARDAFAMGVHGSAIYMAGGLLELNIITEAQPTVATVTSFNTKAREWSVRPSLSEGHDHVGGAVVGNTFYVIGGRINDIPNGGNFVFAMDVTSPNKTWIEKARMPTARGGLSASALGHRIYTFGGEGSRDVVPNGVYNNVEVYDTITDSWEVLPPMPFPRHGTNAATIGCQIHIPGGGNVTGAGAQDRNDYYRVARLALSQYDSFMGLGQWSDKVVFDRHFAETHHTNSFPICELLMNALSTFLGGKWHRCPYVVQVPTQCAGTTSL